MGTIARVPPTEIDLTDRDGSLQLSCRDAELFRYVYRPAVSREQCVRREGRSFLEKAFGGDVAALVAHFVAEASLDRKQIQQLRQLLAQKQNPREKRP